MAALNLTPPSNSSSIRYFHSQLNCCCFYDFLVGFFGNLWSRVVVGLCTHILSQLCATTDVFSVSLYSMYVRTYEPTWHHDSTLWQWPLCWVECVVTPPAASYTGSAQCLPAPKWSEGGWLPVQADCDRHQGTDRLCTGVCSGQSRLACVWYSLIAHMHTYVCTYV